MVSTHAANHESWFLTGPTASGKSLIGLALAEQIGAQIVSLDSMAVYRGMDIGVAKPGPSERAAVTHHLIDRVDPDQEYSLAQYLNDALQVVESLRAAQSRALFVGGTPLYLKALLRGIFQGPPADWEFRQQQQAEAAAQPPGWLHSQLAKVDPRSAAKLHPRDARRLVRALEAHRKTGRPISSWQEQFDRPADPPPPVFVLDWPRAELYQRIDRRVDEMFAIGLVDEVRSLVVQFGGLGRTASQAIGYRETLEYLCGVRDLAATVELVKTRSRQFAKRQLTWFRSLQECRWIAVSTDDDPRSVAQRIVDASQRTVR